MKYGKSKHPCDPSGPHSPARVQTTRGSYSAARRMDRRLAASGLTNKPYAPLGFCTQGLGAWAGGRVGSSARDLL